jgi:AcrR family transcriptional regulator
MKNKRLPPQARGLMLLEVALRQAKIHGLANLTRDQIARAADVSPALVSARLGTMINLRRSVMRHAVASSELRVVAEGLATRDPIALKAPEALRRSALASMS